MLGDPTGRPYTSLILGGACLRVGPHPEPLSHCTVEGSRTHKHVDALGSLLQSQERYRGRSTLAPTSLSFEFGFVEQLGLP